MKLTDNKFHTEGYFTSTTDEVDVIRDNRSVGLSPEKFKNVVWRN